jgi:hypothetical protein
MTWGTTLRTGARAAGLALLVVGCRQIVGIGDDPPSAFGGTAITCGGISFGAQDCQACMQSACCAPAATCAKVAGCPSLVACLGACAPQDDACASGCRGSFAPGDGPEAASVASCEASQCAGACQLSCGGYVYADAACASCGQTSCCNEAAACMSDGECARLASCERACAPLDDDCLALCELAHPDGVTLERAFGACTSDKCAASCIAPEWTCLESPVTAQPGPPAVVRYLISDYESGKGIAGLTVVACGKTDFDCATPRAGPATTGANGIVELPLPDGFFGYTQITGAAYGTVLLFAPPVSRDTSLQFPLPQQGITAALLAPIAQPDPSRGLVIAVPHDCGGTPAAGVELAITPSDGTVPFYFSQKVPAAASSTVTQTDDSGGFAAGGFINAEANTTLTVTATVAADGLSFSWPLFVRPGGFSVVYLYASPP